jgi:hypothetical protein
VRRLYSTRFDLHTSTGEGEFLGYTVPSGMVIVLRDITISAPFLIGAVDAAVSLFVPGGPGDGYQFLHWTSVLTEGSEPYHWTGRQVLNAGEQELLLDNNGGLYTWSISGYLLSI